MSLSILVKSTFKAALFLLIAQISFGQSKFISKTWVSDQGDGTYKNPVLHADYSDPDAIRVGDDYYLTASSFNCIPGLPILHSKDLVNWKLINYALKKQEPEELYSSPQHGKGVWAPSIIFYKGEYRIYYPDPDFGVFMVKAKDPAGDWEKPVLVLPGKGIIDPSSFWDEDGKAYLAIAWAGSRAGVNSLLTVFPMNADGTKVTAEGTHVFDGHKNHHTVEGPKFYKRNGYYYLFAPAGGVATGWQLVLRSKNIYGPYEEQVVMDQGKTNINGPHQGALLQTQTKEDWFLHFQDKGPYGRVLHLQPVKWVNNWPVIGEDLDGDGKGEPVHSHVKPNVAKVYPVSTPPENDEFNGDKLGLQWQWHANSRLQWSAQIRNSGHLRLFAFSTPKDAVNLWPVPNLLLQKFPAPDFTATTKVTFTTEWDVWQTKKAGLLIMGNDYAYLSVTKNEKGYQVNQVVCKNALEGQTETVVETRSLETATVYMRVQVKAPLAECQFSYSEDGVNFKPIGVIFKAVQDKWIGAKIGIFSTSSPEVRTGGYADFDWFRLQ
ncbi:glycoside hydrolase 43 family protein [Pedobacter sp. MC2016-14]|uniref:glycoside hydrolase family 43 protein n=1 Tax=Pedobacter sp. MC2016-14 TaxID=2897327 RepID=UPI001E2E508B|nr:glycoside hydrolase 43 family protein [Pedobacter sp. MC2016-14]MCD0487634.1 glycoside hydrolase 43 family protein [Pedobacter sp. MC2016-14]